MNDLNTVAGAEAELKETEAVYDADRTARLAERQAHRKTLKTLVQSLKDRDARKTGSALLPHAEPDAPADSS